MGLQACARNAYGQNREGGIIVMDKIMQAIPLEDYKIQIKSSSGVTGIFDVKPCLKGGAFKKFRKYISELIIRVKKSKLG